MQYEYVLSVGTAAAARCSPSSLGPRTERANWNAADDKGYGAWGPPRVKVRGASGKVRGLLLIVS